MSDPIDDGGPAYPQGHPEMRDPWQSIKDIQGMTLRDYFAGQALQGLISSQWGGLQKMETFIARSYEFADAMITARKGGPQS